MPKFKDITGQEFGELTVLGLIEMKRGSSLWKCRCSCGAETSVSIQNLRRGGTRSCGCSRRLEFGRSCANSVYQGYRNGARKRELFFEISFEQFLEITSQNCFYCNAPPSNRKTDKGNGLYGEYIYSGIDRVDNTKGYIEGNVVPCCRTCNFAKKTLSYKEFKNWVFSVSSNMLSRELFCDIRYKFNTESTDFERIKENAVN